MKKLLQMELEERYIEKQQKERRLHLNGDILRGNFRLKQVIDGKAEERIEVTSSRERRGKQLPYNHKKKRVYWK